MPQHNQVTEQVKRLVPWLVAIAFGIIALLEAVALIVMMPLKTVVPYTITVDRQTGYVETAAGILPGKLTQNTAVTQAFLAQYVPAGGTPMCGNSIGQDRRFLVKYMPRLEAFFHYRNLDVSTLKELAKRWKPEVHASFKKQQRHTALADVHESIDELQHYRTHFLKLD